MTHPLITFLASFLIWFMVFSLVYFWIEKKTLKREHVVHAAIASLVSWAVATFIKDLFPVPRPFQINGSPTLTLTIPFSSSFPSVHSAVAFALAGALFVHNKKIGGIYLLLALVVGLSRVASNVHDILDIVGGGALGIFISFFLARVHFSTLTRKLRI